VETLWALPVVGAGAGWVLAWGGTRLAFRPRRPWRLGPLTIQGFLPAHRAEIADALAEWVANEVSLREVVEEALGDPERRDALREAVEERLKDHLGEKWGGRLATAAGEAAARLLPPLLKEVAARVEKRLEVGGLVRSKLEGLDDERLERALLAHAGPLLRRLGLLGAGAGFVLGLAFAVVLWLFR